MGADLVDEFIELASHLSLEEFCTSDSKNDKSTLFPKIVDLMKQDCFKRDFLEYLNRQPTYGFPAEVVAEVEQEDSSFPNLSAGAEHGKSKDSNKLVRKSAKDLTASEKKYFERKQAGKNTPSHDEGIVKMLADDDIATVTHKLPQVLREGLINGLQSSTLKQAYLAAIPKKKSITN